MGPTVIAGQVNHIRTTVEQPERERDDRLREMNELLVLVRAALLGGPSDFLFDRLVHMLPLEHLATVVAVLRSHSNPLGPGTVHAWR